MNATQITSVFAYGTLKRGHCRSGVWPAAPVCVRPALVRGTLYDLGPYPAILSGTDWIAGELWTMRPTDIAYTLQVLDEVEGFQQVGQSNWYVRQIVPWYQQIGGAAVGQAYCYLWARGPLPRGTMRMASRIETAAVWQRPRGASFEVPPQAGYQRASDVYVRE
jgi:gamma-glutamylcyclotransferase (GGCT)/AIG2-like uncharacterized protein YtfP